MRKITAYLVTAALFGSVPALAQDTSSPEYIEARQRLQEGKALYAQGNIDGARIKCEQACAVLKTPACLRALGLAQFYTKHYLEAYENLQKSLDDKELDTVQRKQVTDLMQQAYDKTGHLEVHAPAGAHIRIDETIDAGNAPLREVVHVTAGSHTISVTVEQKTERKTVECAEGKIIKIDFEDRFPNLGDHGAGNNPPPVEVERVRSGAGWIVPIAVAGVGLVGMGFGVGFAIASQNAKSDAAALFAQGICANQSSPSCLPYKDKIDAERTNSAISIAGYVAGGALLVTSAVLFAVWPKSERQKATLVPSITPNSAGLSFQGRF